MVNKKVSGKAQGAKIDPAEAWLAANDPDYAEQKKKWTAPTTDALSRINSEINETHHTLQDSQDMGDGNYRQRRHVYGDGGQEESTIQFSAKDGDVLEDDYDEDSRP